MIPEEFLKKVRAIEIASQRLVKEGISGQYMSAFKGTGMQFKEFRTYVYGDDIRHISWNVSARTQDLVLKIFEEERERSLFLVVDVSASLRRGPWAEQKAEKLAEIAATLAVSAAVAKDKFGVLLYSNQIESVIPPAKGKTHLLRVIRDILAFKPVGTKTSPDLALRQIDRVLKKQSIVVLLSDMEVLPDENILRRTSSKHEFLAVHLEHAQEWEIPDVGFLELQTAEQGRPVTVDTGTEAFRRYMHEQGENRRTAIDELFRRGRADLIRVSTGEDYVPKLRDYLNQRKRHGRGRVT